MVLEKGKRKRHEVDGNQRKKQKASDDIDRKAKGTKTTKSEKKASDEVDRKGKPIRTRKTKKTNCTEPEVEKVPFPFKDDVSQFRYFVIVLIL